MHFWIQTKTHSDSDEQLSRSLYNFVDHSSFCPFLVILLHLVTISRHSQSSTSQPSYSMEKNVLRIFSNLFPILFSTPATEISQSTPPRTIDQFLFIVPSKYQYSLSLCSHSWIKFDDEKKSTACNGFVSSDSNSPPAPLHDHVEIVHPCKNTIHHHCWKHHPPSLKSKLTRFSPPPSISQSPRWQHRCWIFDPVNSKGMYHRKNINRT